MKNLCILFGLLAIPASAEVSPDTVVAEVNGKPVTARQVRDLLSGYSVQQRQSLARQIDSFLRGYAIQELLVKQAEDDKLDQESPYKEQLAHLRRQLMANAAMDRIQQEYAVTPDDQRKFYSEHPERYREAKVKLIYISFSNNVLPGTAEGKKKPLTETDAKSQAGKVVQQARAGTDFVQLVKQYSEDPGSAGNGGDLGVPVKSTTKGVPDEVKKIVLAAKPGDITDPVRTENGFWIFRIESIETVPYEKVKDDIYKELKSAGLNNKINEITKQSSVKIKNEEFFKQPSVE